MVSFLDTLKGAFGFGSGAPGDAAQREIQGQQGGIDELRRQFAATQANVQPFVQAGVGQLPALTEGTTAGGLDERLARIFDTDIFSSLVDERERGVRGQLGAAGLQRSGTAIQEAANIPTQIGLMIEKLLTGRSGALAGAGQNAALGLGQLGAGASGGIADLLRQQGVSGAAGVLTGAQEQAAGLGNLFDLGSTIGSIFFSDPALKENIRHVGEVCDLNVYEWDWIEGAKGTIIEKCSTVGFMADEVEILYPEHVDEFCGFMVIDYPALLDDLEAQKWLH